MSVRIAIERHQRWTVFATIAVIAVCFFATRQAYRGDALSDVITRVYFSHDDGKTYFAGGIEKGFDFPHEGKQACRAYVFRCDSGKAFVGYLGRRAASRGGAPATPDARYLGKESAAPGEIEIKKPGGDKWVSLGSVEGQQIVRSLCPKGTPESVLP